MRSRKCCPSCKVHKTYEGRICPTCIDSGIVNEKITIPGLRIVTAKEVVYNIRKLAKKISV